MGLEPIALSIDPSKAQETALKCSLLVRLSSVEDKRELHWAGAVGQGGAAAVLHPWTAAAQGGSTDGPGGILPSLAPPIIVCPAGGWRGRDGGGSRFRRRWTLVQSSGEGLWSVG